MPFSSSSASDRRPSGRPAPRSPHLPALRPALRPVLGGAFAAVLALSPLGVGLAHADFVGADPAPATVVAGAPSTVQLFFSEPVEARFSIFKVYPLDPAGASTSGIVHGTSHGPAHGTAHDHGADPTDGAAPATPAPGDAAGTARALDPDDRLRLNGAAGPLVEAVLQLRDDDDARVDLGHAPASGRATSFALALEPDLAPGPYVVMWRVLAADGHASQGFHVFVVEGAR